MRIESGLIVKSIAGHDKNRFYLVVKIEGGRAFIVDGKRRKICAPKPKNFLHIRATNKLVDVEKYKTDKSIRTLLHDYNYAGKNNVLES